jgi:thioredoxin-like negative regulator of GroEL
MNTIENDAQLNKFTNEGFKVIVCLASWSRVCRTLQKDLELIKNNYEKISFGVVDIDKSSDIRRKHTIASVPTWLIFKDNILLDELATTNQYIIDDSLKKHLLS